MKNVILSCFFLIGALHAMENEQSLMLIKNRVHEPITYTLHVDDTNPQSKNLYAGLGITSLKWKNMRGENNSEVHKAIELPGDYKRWEKVYETNCKLLRFYTILDAAKKYLQVESAEWQNIEGQNFFHVTLPYPYNKEIVEEWYKVPGSLIRDVYTKKEFEPIKDNLLTRQIVRDIMNIGVNDYTLKNSCMETSLCNCSCDSCFCSCCPNIHRLECKCTSDEQKIINDGIEKRFNLCGDGGWDCPCGEWGFFCTVKNLSRPSVGIHYKPGHEFVEKIAQKYGLPQNYQSILKGRIDYE